GTPCIGDEVQPSRSRSVWDTPWKRPSTAAESGPRAQSSPQSRIAMGSGLSDCRSEGTRPALTSAGLPQPDALSTSTRRLWWTQVISLTRSSSRPISEARLVGRSLHAGNAEQAAPRDGQAEHPATEREGQCAEGVLRASRVRGGGERLAGVSA